jgi:hypothetical protein
VSIEPLDSGLDRPESRADAFDQRLQRLELLDEGF